jgi:hypothetical protein
MHDRSAEYTYNDGSTYRGSILGNQMSGECRITYPNSSQFLSYSGEIFDGKLSGLGIL